MKTKPTPKTTTNPKPKPAQPDSAQAASSNNASEAPPRYAAPPPVASVVIASILAERAAKAFCPDVGEDAPEWARRTAQMVLFSIMPMRLRSGAECGPPPLPGLDLNASRDLIAKILAKHGARPVPSSSASCSNRRDEAFKPPARLWEAIQLVPPVWALKLERKASEDYRDGFHCGRVSGALTLLPPEITKGAEGLVEYERQQAAQLPSERAADFFAGLRDGEKQMRGMPERARQMAQRTKIFRAIAVSWKEVAPGILHSTGELHRWLLSKGAIVPGTESREIRKVCKLIGLRYSKQ